MRLVNRYTPASPHPFPLGRTDKVTVGERATSRIPSRVEYDRLYSYCEGLKSFLRSGRSHYRDHYHDGEKESRQWMSRENGVALATELKFWRNELSHYRKKHFAH